MRDLTKPILPGTANSLLALQKRIIGSGMVGTMGTEVDVLRQRRQHVFYLWDVCNEITTKVNAAEYGLRRYR